MGKRKPRVVDLFSGAGGISEGFHQAGYRVLAGADVDPDAIATYKTNFPRATAILGDMRDPEIREQVLDAAVEADVVVGGPPCQGFSQVRSHSRLIDDPKNSLYREFVAILEEAEPRVFIVENVPGMAQMGCLDQVWDDLECGGKYRVLPTVVDAADFGVPQTRKRLVFVGYHDDLDLEPPSIVGTGATATLDRHRATEADARRRYTEDDEAQLLEQLADESDTTAVTVEQALGDLIGLRAGTTKEDTQSSAVLTAPTSAYQRQMREGLNGTISNVGVPRINEDTVRRLEAIPPGGNHLDLPDALKKRYLSTARWGQDNGSGLLSRKHFYAYRRLHPHFWSWTLNTKADSVYHWDNERALSVREFARLQSFPDRFIVTTDPTRGPLPGRIDGGPGHSRYRQIGNAVPPLLARAIALAVKKAAT